MRTFVLVVNIVRTVQAAWYKCFVASSDIAHGAPSNDATVVHHTEAE